MKQRIENPFNELERSASRTDSRLPLTERAAAHRPHRQSLSTVPKTPRLHNGQSFHAKAAFMLSREPFSLIYGPEQIKELETLIDFPFASPVTAPETLDPETRDSIEVIFSGWGVPRMDRSFLDLFPNLKAVFHGAGSIKSFVSDTLWDRGIRVSSAAKCNAIPVAEYTLSQIIFCLKHGWQTALELREKKIYRERDDRIPGLVGSTVGILSLGHTGREVVKRTQRLDLNILAYDPFASEEDARRLGVKLCSLEDVFAQSHVVSCHTPLLPETTGLIRQSHFESMPSGASFINTARGAVVNEPELIAALENRPDIFAVLDVTYPEPPAADSPLLSLPNAIVTPHIAGSLSRECRSMGEMMVQEFKRYLNHEPLEGEVIQQQLSAQA